MRRNAGGNSSGPPAEIDTAKLYEEASGRWRDFKERIGPSIAAVVNFAQIIAESDTFPGDKSETLKGLRQSAEKLVILDQETNNRSDVCIEVRRRIVREAHYGEPAENDVELYNAELAKKEGLRPAVEHSDGGRYLRDIDDAIKSVSGDGDELVVAGGRVVASRCPVTGCELENPVANKNCGHVYSTSGIIGYLWQKNGRKSDPPSKLDAVPEFFAAACPNAGCSASVSRTALARDFVTERSQRMARLGSAPQRSMNDDDMEDVEDLRD